ncbi:hypothetical protein BsWGS_04887 [Bradybaena similaris]
MYTYGLLLVTVFLAECQAQCIGITCGECISSSYSCSWCRQTNFTESRCQPKSTLLRMGCEAKYIENPESNMYNVEDEEVRDGDGPNTNAVQIQPQRVRIVTRPRKEYRIPMTFRAANNFPVDLYFLFDNSKSMEPQIKNLAKLANDIGISIGSISSNYLMGYGVFQDKVIMPFTETAPLKLTNPCYDKYNPKSICAPPFEFRHLLNMTRNITAFKEQVDKTEVTGNVDYPEGSFDAILQAIKCQSEVGWRSVGRKLLIFASNDRFHLAGDGRLAGIVIPNDGHCHLDAAGKYTKELVQDYPSVAQLADIVEHNEVHIIFAVTHDQHPLYKMLSDRIPQSIVELLASPNDTSNRNIKEIIEKKYREMVSEVEITHTKVRGVDVEIRATSAICQEKGTNKCKGLQIGTKVDFDVEVKVTECPPNPKDRIKEIVIYPESLRNDRMVLEIEMLCECPCTSNQSTWDATSNVCTAGNGTLKCGLCECHQDRYGSVCECDATDLDGSNAGCRKPGENSTLQCSGTGRCECGVCKCDEGYSGPFCECNDQACGRLRGEICGGTQGRCVCGRCVCESGYTGNVCECPTSNSTCLYDEKLCNNAGVCECGECICKTPYVGRYCENCILCGDTVCEVPRYRGCAQCAFSNKTTVDCPKDCPEIRLVDTLENVDGSSVCSIIQDDGCSLYFQITGSSDGTDVVITVQKTATCPEPVSIVPIAAGVVGGVVAIGLLLLLLWKILTTIFDRIEYSKFEEDLKQCKWAQQDNPFYKGATTTYKNPMVDTSDMK